MEEASTVTNPRDWQFPDMPKHASQDTINTVNSIMDQCWLVRSPDSGKDIKFNMVQRVQFSWHPEHTKTLQRERALCAVVYALLRDLLIAATTKQVVIAGCLQHLRFESGA